MKLSIIALLFCGVVAVQAAQNKRFLDPYNFGWLYFIKPQDFDVDFWLYTKDNIGSKEVISTNNLGSRFITGARTIFIIHGYINTGTESWIAPMKNELLSLPEPLNVIVVDWKAGAFSTYAQSAENTKTVGKKTGDLIKSLKENKGVDYSNFHVIGHSLGAHAAGFTGKRITALTGDKVGRVTGLDPAGYNFAIANEQNRLAKGDGDFVDIMHTNTVLTLSLGTPIGDADFYPNGGRSQPGCSMFIVACSHMRAPTLFTNSIKTCQYQSRGCPNGAVIPGARMGYHASSSLSGKYCLDTTSSAPYC